jgi:hypothetical protein
MDYMDTEIQRLRRQLRAYQEFAQRVEEIHGDYPEGNASWLYLAARAKLYGAERAEGLVKVPGRVEIVEPGASQEVDSEEDTSWLD